MITVILSFATYQFIEKPARNKNNKFNIVLSLIAISFSVLIIFNLNNIFNNGHKNRLPKLIQENLQEKPWTILKDLNGEQCFENIQGCKFNQSSDNKVYMIGDSHMATLSIDLKDRVIRDQYQFITSILSACIFFPDFDLVRNQNQIDKKCNDEYFQKVKRNLLNEKTSIIIFGGRFPLYLSNYWFNNREGGSEGEEWNDKYIPTKKFKYDVIQDSFKNEVIELSKKHKIILIYPIPEVGWNPNIKIFFNRNNKFSKQSDLNDLTTSYTVFQDRTKSSFEMLDSIKGENVYRVYPHTLFCNRAIKNRCVTHDDNNLFYSDDDHPSLKGAKMINELIMKEIRKIEIKIN